MDGTDCPIYEPTPFNEMWYLHNFKGPAVRYEVSVAIKTGFVVSFNGPFPCGSCTDITIFCSSLKNIGCTREGD